MTKEKGLQPYFPSYPEDTPTPCVASKKIKKKTLLSKATNSRRLLKPTASSRARARSVSPKSGPWVPAPGKATRGGRVPWLQSYQKQEIHHVRNSDLLTDEEDRVGGEVRKYEKKISHLINEVGTLKNEVVLHKALQEIENKEDLLNTSTRMLQRQEEKLEHVHGELQHVEAELVATESENKLLRKSMELVAEEAEATNSSVSQVDEEIRICGQTSSLESSINALISGSSFSETRVLNQKEQLNFERERLMKKLIEAELDGQAAAHQVKELKDLIRRLIDEQHFSPPDQARLLKQKELFLKTLADFESTNRALRHLLRDQHRLEASGLRLAEQREILLRRLADSDLINERMRNQLLDCEAVISDLKNQLRLEKEERQTLSNIQGSLESTRGHLQKQLRSKEADCNRMSVQLKTLEKHLKQETDQREELLDVLNSYKSKAEKDKEALKKAARAHKSRAEKLEQELRHVTKQLTEVECQDCQHVTRLNSANSQLENFSREKQLLASQCSQQKEKIAELEQLLDRMEENLQSQNESYTARLHDKITENATLRLECERLKSSVAFVEEKLKKAEEDAEQLRGMTKQYEKLVEEFKEQATRMRSEADESSHRYEEQSREKEKIQRDGEHELEKVKQRLQQRLQELEPLPELLRATELRLQEANEKILAHEKRHLDNTKVIAELTAQLDCHTEALDHFKSKCNNSHDSSRSLQSKYESMERRLRELEEKNMELENNQSKLQETLHQETLRLDEKTRENASLTRQLETALTDGRRHGEQTRDRYLSKEKTYQARIVDLETQLSQLRAEQTRVKREKDENERKFNSRLYDLKDRLEQCQSSNRSMQNYVQFLKNSYSNVFGDNLASSLPPPLSPIKPFP